MKCCNPECEAPLTKKPKVWEVKGWTRCVVRRISSRLRHPATL